MPLGGHRWFGSIGNTPLVSSAPSHAVESAPVASPAPEDGGTAEGEPTVHSLDDAIDRGQTPQQSELTEGLEGAHGELAGSGVDQEGETEAAEVEEDAEEDGRDESEDAYHFSASEEEGEEAFDSDEDGHAAFHDQLDMYQAGSYANMFGAAGEPPEYSATLAGLILADEETSSSVDVAVPADLDDDLVLYSSENSVGSPQAGVPDLVTATVAQAALSLSEQEEPPATLAELAFINQAATAWTDPLSFSNPNPATIGPSNYGLLDFIRLWARQGRISQVVRDNYPCPIRASRLEETQPSRIEYEDLEGDEFDFQGVDWDELGVTRASARERRLLTYSNYVNVAWSDRWKPDLPDVALPRTNSFFRFRRMDIKRNTHLSHFQLRNLFASTSHSRVFYPAVGAVQQYNPMSGRGRAVVRFSHLPIAQVSTLAADYGVLVAGSFGGEYMLRHLDSGEPEATACHGGTITRSVSGITNHVAIHQARRSSLPLAVFASNDNRIRVLDLATETWLSEQTLGFAPNCTALSPDRRLRVIVGDSLHVAIAAAESQRPDGSAEILHDLSGHRDFGFACDWADDGWTIATSFQDKSVKIWDARRLTDSSGRSTSVCTIRSEMAGVRSLRFSPIGSGKRVLVAAEEADFVNIIDAQTFKTKQTVDIFGELGGISFANGGQDLMVLCCDRTHGGILQLERCGQDCDGSMTDLAEGDHVHGGFRPRRRRQVLGHVSSIREDDPASKLLAQRFRDAGHDWPRSYFTEEKHARGRVPRRRRRAGAQVDIEPF